MIVKLHYFVSWIKPVTSSAAKSGILVLSLLLGKFPSISPVVLRVTIALMLIIASKSVVLYRGSRRFLLLIFRHKHDLFQNFVLLCRKLFCSVLKSGSSRPNVKRVIFNFRNVVFQLVLFILHAFLYFNEDWVTTDSRFSGDTLRSSVHVMSTNMNIFISTVSRLKLVLVVLPSLITISFHIDELFKWLARSRQRLRDSVEVIGSLVINWTILRNDIVGEPCWSAHLTSVSTDRFLAS